MTYGMDVPLYAARRLADGWWEIVAPSDDPRRPALIRLMVVDGSGRPAGLTWGETRRRCARRDSSKLQAA